MNTPGGNTVSTAQLAVSLICSLARKIPAADMSIKQGLWDRKSFMGLEMNGKTLGIIGCGRVSLKCNNVTLLLFLLDRSSSCNLRNLNGYESNWIRSCYDFR